MNSLKAIEAANAALILGMNAIESAQKINATLLKAQSEGREISQAEWADIESQADQADARLAAAIRDGKTSG